jgi:hypothetical protein
MSRHGRIAGGIKMSTQTTNPSPSVLNRFLASRRSPGWMQARVAFNIWRILLGVFLLCSVPWTGSLALLGTIPLAWAAVSFGWMYRVRHSAQN